METEHMIPRNISLFGGRQFDSVCFYRTSDQMLHT
jgi:hypothetical protein